MNGDKAKVTCICGKEVELQSNCCAAPVVVGGGDGTDREGQTYYYVCTKCERACDANLVELHGNHKGGGIHAT